MTATSDSSQPKVKRPACLTMPIVASWMRLPALLRRAGAADVAAEVDMAALARVLPQVKEEAMRLRRAEGAEVARIATPEEAS